MRKRKEGGIRDGGMERGEGIQGRGRRVTRDIFILIAHNHFCQRNVTVTFIVEGYF